MFKDKLLNLKRGEFPQGGNGGGYVPRETGGASESDDGFFSKILKGFSQLFAILGKNGFAELLIYGGAFGIMILASWILTKFGTSTLIIVKLISILILIGGMIFGITKGSGGYGNISSAFAKVADATENTTNPLLSAITMAIFLLLVTVAMVIPYNTGSILQSIDYASLSSTNVSPFFDIVKMIVGSAVWLVAMALTFAVLGALVGYSFKLMDGDGESTGSFEKQLAAWVFTIILFLSPFAISSMSNKILGTLDAAPGAKSIDVNIQNSDVSNILNGN